MQVRYECREDENDSTAEVDEVSTHADALTDREIDCRGAGGIDAACDRLITQFGAVKLTDQLIERFQSLTGVEAHPFLRTGLFCSHRDLAELLDAYERGESFYLYTGRGPSDGMHLGHLVPFMFTQYLQRAFDVPCVIQLTDDEKFLHKGLSLEQCAAQLNDNVKDIIACGFDPAKTYIFSNFNAIGDLYPRVCQIQRHLTCNQLRATFGIVGSDSPGKMSFPAMQMAPAMALTFPFLFDLEPGQQLRCLIPCGLDQDPYFRLTRDVAHKMGEIKPAVLQSKFLPALEGCHTKMSANTGIKLNDTVAVATKKMKAAFSGGQDSLETQIKHGANLEVDVALRYLHVFAKLAFPEAGGPPVPVRTSRKLLDLVGELEMKQGDLEAVNRMYRAGKMLSGEVKKMAADQIQCENCWHNIAVGGRVSLMSK